MDLAVIIFMLVIYLLWQALTNVGTQQKPRPKSRQNEPRPQPPGIETGNPELDEALREIREAMGAPAGQSPRPERPRQETPRQPSPDVQRSPSDDYRERREKFQRERRRVDQETREREKESRRAMDEQLERQRELSRRAAAAEKRATHRTTAPSLKSAAQQREQEERHPGHAALVERLYQPDSVRDAIVMKEILGPPRAQSLQRQQSHRRGA